MCLGSAAGRHQVLFPFPKWGREVLFPPNPNLADILGDTYFDFENFYLLVCEVVWEFLFTHFNGQGLNGKEDSMDGEGFNGW